MYLHNHKAMDDDNKQADLFFAKLSPLAIVNIIIDTI